MYRKPGGTLLRAEATPDSRAGGRGNIYLIALLVLLALTLVLVALVFLTQTEVMIGSTDRTIQRVFYAAESGLSIGAARILVRHDKQPASILLDDAPPAGVAVRSKIDLAPAYPIADPPCDYCQINNAGEYRSSAYYRVNHVLTVRASLVGPEGQEVAHKRLADMIDLQPWQESLPPVDVPPEEQEAVEF